VLARVTPLFFIAPLFSSAMIPPRVRGHRRGRISIGLTPIAMHGQHVPSDTLLLAGIVIEGMLVGLSFAFALAVLIAARRIGRLADRRRLGLLLRQPDQPDERRAERGHRALLLAGGHADLPRDRRRRLDAARPRAHVPTRPAHAGAAMGSLVGGAEQVFSTIFTSALEIAAPVLVALLITDVAFGIVSRVVPQLNIFAVGFPTKVTVALLVVGASLPFVVQLDLRPAHRERRCGARRDARGVTDGQHDRTEKATPKHRQRARDKGQVARSAELGGSLVVVAGLLAISVTGPRSCRPALRSFREMLGEISHPDRATTAAGLSELMHSMRPTRCSPSARSPARACLAGVGSAGVAQVGFRPTAHVLKPDFRRINPASGLKNLLGPNLRLRSAQGDRQGRGRRRRGGAGAAAGDDAPVLQGRHLAGGPRRAVRAAGVGHRAARRVRVPRDRGARLRLEALPPRETAEDDQAAGQGRDRSTASPPRSKCAAPPPDAARALAHDGRGPDADVVVTNPTHYAVALRYDGTRTAPEVVAKGKDLIAAQIRRIAEENDVPIVPDPPLARALHQLDGDRPDDSRGALRRGRAGCSRSSTASAGRRRLAS
jgi:hypothetical protein